MGTAVTPATDLYATGMIAYELLAGRHPYEGVDAPMALMLRHANDEPAPLGRVREDLPPGIAAWVHAMLAKHPAARPASAADAWDRLEGEVADELGPRWRRAAALPEPGATWGYVSVVTTAAPDVVPRRRLRPRRTSLRRRRLRRRRGCLWRRRFRLHRMCLRRCRSPLHRTCRRLRSPPRRTTSAPPLDPSPRPRRPRALSLVAVMAATLVLGGGSGGLSLLSRG